MDSKFHCLVAIATTPKYKMEVAFCPSSLNSKEANAL